MDSFEKMIMDLAANKEKVVEKIEKVEKNLLGSVNGEAREIVIRYCVGDEANAKIVAGTPKSGHAEDVLAMMNVIGNLSGELASCDGSVITSKIIGVVTAAMQEQIMAHLSKMLQGLVGVN